MKHMQSCLRARKDRKHFSPLWRPCETHASLSLCGKDLIKPFSPPMRCSEARVGLFKYQQRLRKQFSPQGRSCEARASICMCWNDLTNPF